MAETNGKRDWLDALQKESSSSGLPRPDLNPLVNPLLGENMGRWAQVYFTTPPEQREQAVEKLLEELQAEAEGKKLALSETTTPVARAASPSSYKNSATAANKPDMAGDFPASPPPMPQFTKTKPKTLEIRENDSVVCQGCLHKNAAEQRFCGICGAPLGQELVAREMQPYPVREPAPQANVDPQNQDSDWQWLRQRNLAHLETVERTRGKNGSRLLPGLIVLAVITGTGYFVWRNSNASLPQAPVPPRSAVKADSASNVPATVVPPPTSPERAVEAKPSKMEKQDSNLETASAARASTTRSGALADTGQDELEQGLRYLNGSGVPRNSWMASEWLWKAVAKHNNDAVLLLSDLYARGDGVPRSCEQARILLVASAKKGSAAAAQKLRSLETSCSK